MGGEDYGNRGHIPTLAGKDMRTARAIASFPDRVLIELSWAVGRGVRSDTFLALAGQETAALACLQAVIDAAATERWLAPILHYENWGQTPFSRIAPAGVRLLFGDYRPVT